MSKILILGCDKSTIARIALAQAIASTPSPVPEPVILKARNTGLFNRYYEPASEKHPNEQWRGKGKRRKPRN